jgi:hypothetical protein
MDPEIDAMSKVAEALKELENDARNRVLKWASDKYNVKFVGRKSSDLDSNDKRDTDEAENDDLTNKYDTFADLYEDAAPTTNQDKFLVAGYWHQIVCGESNISSASLNKDLKDLGHGVTDISHKFDAFKSTKPQLIIQLKKTGTSKQGRKQYKLTKAGIDKVKEMLGK